MKKIVKKINNNKFLFTLIILIVFVTFDFFTNGIGAWEGLISKITSLFFSILNYTYYGYYFIGELVWFLLLIPIILIFKNKYIFNQNKEKLSKSILIAWPILLYSFVMLIKSILQIDVSIVKGYEVVSLMLLTLTIGLFEEIMCRGWIQNEFIERFGNNRKGVIFSIIISGSLFGIMHITNLFYGQDLFTTLIQILSTIVIGVALGSIYYRTKNIWSVIILHGIWDFCVLFADINIASTCTLITSQINNITPILGLFALFFSVFTSIPEFCLTLVLFSKSEINIGMNKKNKIKLSDEEMKHDKNSKRIISIITLIFIIVYAALSLSVGRTKSNSCPVYVDMPIENYTETIYNYSNYDLTIFSENEQLYEYNFSINDNYELIITDKSNYIEYTLEYKNVLSLSVFEDNGVYNIILLTETNKGDVIAYYSNFITRYNIDNSEEFINSFIKSFRQIMVPVNINSIGYYQDSNNENKYPLFISKTNYRYVLYPDGTIYKYNNIN